MTDTLQLKDTVRYLGSTLGDTIKTELGDEWLQRIEHIRQEGRASFKGDEKSTDTLAQYFAGLDNQELMTVGRAFAQFLNLANIAEQEYNSAHQSNNSLQETLLKIKSSGANREQVLQAVKQLNIDLVLTAHPTEVTRRTLIHKHSELAKQLQLLHNTGVNEVSAKKVKLRIANLISQAWHTEEIRDVRPTPVDEARWGFSVIENSLWEAVPDFLRDLDEYLTADFDYRLPIELCPVQFSSWMGGDRDGNPFVTSKVTEQVLLLARKRAARLFADDIEHLQVELSMSSCSEELREIVGDSKEPYRAILRPLRLKLRATVDGILEHLAGNRVNQQDWISQEKELYEPLLACYQSLHACGMSIVADGALLDTIRRSYCFGIHLLKLDIRQDAERHTDVLSEVTRHLGVGDYAQWTEQDRQAFLLRELGSKRPLFPTRWTPSDDVKEVINTCQTIAKHSREGFGIYIISMASEPSDVMAVQLLLKESGVDWPMPVAPLFETLDDLNSSPAAMDKLLSIDWYRGYINGKQYVMIGYSDSAKDAGSLAAGWAQYQSQEALVALAEKHSVGLTLFHGRGGTIGRGGLPARAAIHSQPPGSLTGGFRVTEQGETIRYKFGMSKLAKSSLSIYAGAVIEALVAPPPAPKEEWREVIQLMADQARDNYRHIVRDSKDFVPYFRAATPEQELGKLPLGSRPAKRKPTGGIESLRAIPWIFAWAQTRLVLPSWLGVMKAVKQVNEKNPALVSEMVEQWPFFKSRLSMLDMVFQKADPSISEAYDKRLVPEELKHFGKALRDELTDSIAELLKLTRHQEIMQDDEQGKESMNIRAGYLQPLHFLQIELLDRIRKGDTAASSEKDIEVLERAMMIAITGIAIGMRNTG